MGRKVGRKGGGCRVRKLDRRRRGRLGGAS